MMARTVSAIALHGYYFMSLDSGRRLTRNHWNELPMPTEVINRVHILARRCGANRGLLFADRGCRRPVIMH